MSLESTAIHEAAHGALALLAEDVIGAPEMISALPYRDSLGQTIMARGSFKDFSPAATRAFGRMLVGGGIAQRLAGFESPGLGGDARIFGGLALAANRGSDFTQECVDGAEFLLRAHWGGIVKIADLLLRGGGSLCGAAEINYARDLLREKPAHPLAPSLEELEKLALSLVKIPEFAVAIRRARAALGPPARV